MKHVESVSFVSIVRKYAAMTAVVLLLISFAAVRASGPARSDEAAAGAVVEIDGASSSKKYSRMIFGGFLEHFGKQVYGGVFDPGNPLSDKNGFRKDVIAALKEIDMPVVRWPGGCFASGYHWEDGVGEKREPVPDPVWGVTDPNTFGTDEFIQWCRLVGCEPYICTNAGNGTPEEMVDWLEYCNATEGKYAEMRAKNGHPEPYNVKYWSIGNENYGFWEIGRYSPKTWGPFVGKCADMLLKADPDIKLFGPVWRPKIEWYRQVMESAGDDLDYISVHQYWIRTGEIPSYKRLIQFSHNPEKSVSTVIGILEEVGYRGKVKIAFDEWNLRGWYHPHFPRKHVVKPDDEKARQAIAKREFNLVAEQYNMADALFSACFLNACLRHCEDVGMANIAPIVNTRGPLYVHPEGIVKRTSFYTFKLYANELEERVVPLELKAGKGRDSTKQIDAIATVDADGEKWAVALVNRSASEPIACAIKLDGRPLDGEYDAKILTGDSPEAYNSVENPDRVVSEKTKAEFSDGLINLPPHSLTIIRVSSR